MFPKKCWILTFAMAVGFSCVLQPTVRASDKDVSQQEPVFAVAFPTNDLPVWTMDEKGEPQFDPSLLISHIRSQVAPESWKDERVNIVGDPKGQHLIVIQSHEVVDRIQIFLGRLRAFAERDPSECLQRNCQRGVESTRHVLLFVSDPHSSATDEFFALKDGEVASSIVDRAFRNYIVQCASPVQARRLEFWKQANMDSSTSLIAVVDADGTKLAEARFEDFRKQGQLDTEAFAAFLDQHADKFPNAETELQTALAKAAQEDKLVLVQMGGPGCGPCISLSRLLGEQASVVSKDYVHLKLDTRMESANRVKQELVGELNVIPWMAIVSSDRKVLATSVGPDGNIGFPSTDTSKAHFREMLESTSKRLTPDDIDALLKAIEEK